MVTISTVLSVAIIVLVILVIFYLSPFFMSPVAKRSANLWGFWLGGRKRKALLSYATTAEDKLGPDDLEKLNTKLKDEAQNEFAMLEQKLKGQERVLQEELEALRKRMSALEEKS